MLSANKRTNIGPYVLGRTLCYESNELLRQSRNVGLDVVNDHRALHIAALLSVESNVEDGLESAISHSGRINSTRSISALTVPEDDRDAALSGSGRTKLRGNLVEIRLSIGGLGHIDEVSILGGSSLNLVKNLCFIVAIAFIRSSVVDGELILIKFHQRENVGVKEGVRRTIDREEDVLRRRAIFLGDASIEKVRSSFAEVLVDVRGSDREVINKHGLVGCVVSEVGRNLAIIAGSGEALRIHIGASHAIHSVTGDHEDTSGLVGGVLVDGTHEFAIFDGL